MADVVFEQYITGDNTETAFRDEASPWVAETFTPTARHTMNFVKVRLRRELAADAPGLVTATIRSTTAGVPTSTILKSGTFNADAVETGGTGEFVTIFFPGGVILEASTVYALGLKSSSDDANGAIRWRRDSSGSYAGGAAYTSSDLGVTWTFLGGGSSDFMFGEWGEAAQKPVVSTGALSAIEATTATCAGSLSDLGQSSVTEHGHVWATTIDPDTSDFKTTLGAGSLGDFSSDLTSLTEGQKYYIRAYATNTQGTSFGEGKSWTSGSPGTVLEPREIAVVGTQFRYVGEDGQEYWTQGIIP